MLVYNNIIEIQKQIKHGDETRGAAEDIGSSELHKEKILELYYHCFEIILINHCIRKT